MKVKLGKIKLNNGVKIPSLGIGTWQIPSGEDLVKSLQNAIALGYRYIDTAAIYENEESVADAIRRSEVKRSDLFLFPPSAGRLTARTTLLCEPLKNLSET